MIVAAPHQLTIGHRASPVDVAHDEPVRVGWRLREDLSRLTPGTDHAVIVEHRVHVTLEPTREPAHDTGWCPGDAWAVIGPGVLLPGRRYAVRVAVRTAGGHESVYSHPMRFGTAPGHQWAAADPIWSDPDHPWAFLVGEHELGEEPVLWAGMFVTAWSGEASRQYVHRTWCNGRIVGVGPVRAVAGETRFDGWDVTHLLRPGVNRIAAQCWAAEGRGYQALLAVGRADGGIRWYGTSADWWARSGVGVYADAGSIGTSFFTAPREHLDGLRWPPGFPDDARSVTARAGRPRAGWSRTGWLRAGWSKAGVVARVPELRPTPASSPEHQLRRPVVVDEVNPGHYRVDYGRTWLGGLRLQLPGDPDRALGLQFGEQRGDDGSVRAELTTGNHFADRWTCGGRSAMAETWGLRVFRYAEITGAPSGWGVDDIPALAQVAPLGDPAGAFACSSDDLTAAWSLSRNTIESLNHQLAVDSWTREREPYEADLYIQTLAHLAVSADPTVMAYSLEYLLHRRTWPTEWPWYLVLTAEELYRHTGDLDALARHRDRLAALLPVDLIDPGTGLITKTEGSDGSASRVDHDLVDWPPGERDDYVFTDVNTVINAIGYRALRAMADIERALGREADAAGRGRVADRLSAAIRERLWDDAAGAFVDGLDGAGRPVDHHAQHAGVFAAGLGVADDRQRDRVASGLVKRGLAVSVYASGFALRTLFAAGRAAEAIAMITAPTLRSWRHMIEIGSGSTMEAWDPALKPNLSFSHPWGAWPAHLITRHLLGVEPVEPGFGQVRVRPQLGDLDWVDGVVPTIRGPIRVRAERDPGAAGGMRVQLDLPGGVRRVD